MMKKVYRIDGGERYSRKNCYFSFQKIASLKGVFTKMAFFVSYKVEPISLNIL